MENARRARQSSDAVLAPRGTTGVEQQLKVALAADRSVLYDCCLQTSAVEVSATCPALERWCARPWPQFVHPSDLPMAVSYRESGPFRMLLRLDRDDGLETWVEVVGELALDDRGEPDHVTAVIKDMTDRLDAELALAEQNDRFDAALRNMPHGLCMFDGDRRLILCNAAYRALYALPDHLARPGAALDDILDYRAANGTGPVDRTAYFDVVAETGAKGRFASTHIELQDGRTIAITHNPMANHGYVATHEDVTESLRAAAQIAHMARHDALTGLPNRTLLRERLDAALANPQSGLAVLCIDLDRFKEVNDTLGHPVGDALLRQVTQRLMQNLRGNDVVARFGGDEFVVLLPDLASKARIGKLADRLVQAMAKPFEIDAHRIEIGASIGLARAPDDAGAADELLKNADLALYEAKAQGRGCFRFFDPAMASVVQDRRRLEADLRQAVRDQAFSLHYQPEISAETGVIVGFEALLRWRHPHRGEISPCDFIPLAEETGEIIRLGEWVLRQACLDAAGWPGAPSVAVNLSPVQFKNAGLVHTIISALATSGLPPQRLEVEITEALLLADSEATLNTLHQIQKLGVRITVDDFGAGYSSLTYLRLFPFDKIKIDKSFVEGVTDGGHSAAIVQAVVGLGASLGVTTIAEGVETREQLEHLRRHGCQEVQGYFLGRPGPSEDARTMLLASRLPRID